MSKLQEDPKAFVGFAPWTLISQEPSLLLSSFLAVLLIAASTRHAAFQTGDAFLYRVLVEGDDGLSRSRAEDGFRLSNKYSARSSDGPARKPRGAVTPGHTHVLGTLDLGSAGRKGGTKGQGEETQLPVAALKGHHG